MSSIFNTQLTFGEDQLHEYRELVTPDEMINDEPTAQQGEDTGMASSNHNGLKAASNSLQNGFFYYETPCQTITSLQELKQATYDYLVGIANIVELVVCIGIYVLGHVLPQWFESRYTWSSPIPFQVVSDSGQVLLDLELSHDVRRESVPDSTKTLFCVVMPLTVLVLMGLMFGPKRDVHTALCLYLVSTGFAAFFTNTIKMYTGRFRPNFYKMCGFHTNTLKCQEDDSAQVTKAQRSFPSGHASLAFASMTVLSLYLLGKVGIQRLTKGNHYRIKKVLAVFAVSPMILAFYIAASRVHDFYHHPADIVAGSLLGATCALFAHGLWYPSVYSPFAGYPLQTLHDNLTAERHLVVETSSNDESVPV